MKYIIMADGKGSRWNNYLNIPKHLYKINNTSIIETLVNKLLKNNIKDIIITSHDKRYEINGAKRYEPLNNKSEIDKFTYELITDDIVFLYGDTYYSDETISTIINTPTSDILFFGNNESIVGIKIKNSIKFKNAINNLKKIKDIKGNGWNIYQYLNNLELNKKQIKDNFIVVNNDYNINSILDVKRVENEIYK